MNNWTVNATEVLQNAQGKAYNMNHPQLEPLHLLWALLSETGLPTQTLRRLELPRVGASVLADTVGFISDLPHELVAAFRSTLQESVQATLNGSFPIVVAGEAGKSVC